MHHPLCCGTAAMALLHAGTLLALLLIPSSTVGFAVVAPISASRSIIPSCRSSTTTTAVQARKQRNVGPCNKEGQRSNVEYPGFGTVLSLWTAVVITTSASMAGATTTTSTMLAVAEPSTISSTVGAHLFQANCAGCHAGGMNFISEKKTLQKGALENYLGSTDPIQIQKYVQKGMPHKLLPFARAFTDQDYGSVASYVSDQAVNEKW